MNNSFYTIDKVAEILGMHHKTIRKFISEGKLRANKVGKQWRISGYDLDDFMKDSTRSFNDNGIGEESSIDFHKSEQGEGVLEKKISVSTVVDINGINVSEYCRISSTLIAIVNSKDPEIGSATVNVKHDKEENKLRVMLWGEIKFIEGMLETISVLVEQDN